MSASTRSLHVRARTAFLAATSLVAACGPHRLAVIAPIPDAEVTARALEDDTGLKEPLQIVFDWQLNDGGQRAHGRGVARVEPPDRARLDLFLDNGETVVSAALVGAELRLPPGAPDDVLPPPDMMWGALGIFRPHPGTRLLGGDRLEDQGVRLTYAYDDGRQLQYEAVDGALRSLELLDGKYVVQRVDVSPERSEGYPVEATYRNLTDFRELKLVRKSLERHDPFAPDIWDPRS
jgi:hypothetical protein